MKGVILDTVTGETHMGHSRHPVDWFSGNYACDCNRWPDHLDPPDGDTCEGCRRFLVVGAIFEPGDEPEPGDEQYTLMEFNDDYPFEMLIEFDVPIDVR